MERMGTGQQVALCGSDPAAKAKEWRRVAEQYQSAFGQTLCVYCYTKFFQGSC